jgi:hypothetical protein
MDTKKMPPAEPANNTISPAKPANFFQECDGTNSSMRLMCFTSLIAAIVFGALTLQLSTKDTKDLKQDTSTGLYITFGFLISAFAPKAVQKFAEAKLPPKS